MPENVASGLKDAIPAALLGVLVVLGFFFDNWRDDDRVGNVVGLNHAILAQNKDILRRLEIQTEKNAKRADAFIAKYDEQSTRMREYIYRACVSKDGPPL